MNDIYNTFLAKSDWAYDNIVPISPDASNRKYFRLLNSTGSTILMDAKLESVKSFDAFQDVAKYLHSIGLSAPEIYASDRAHRLMLLQDLGTGHPALAFLIFKTRLAVIHAMILFHYYGT